MDYKYNFLSDSSFYQGRRLYLQLHSNARNLEFLQNPLILHLQIKTQPTQIRAKGNAGDVGAGCSFPAGRSASRAL